MCADIPVLITHFISSEKQLDKPALHSEMNFQLSDL